ncbi:hypothetical protein [Streptomyces sp. NPDC094049]|uniref:hypothetical protein n=1 Tax=Streptomyces sp. NPDC094049 TaxID=3154987 RepID=UPI00332F92FA
MTEQTQTQTQTETGVEVEPVAPAELESPAQADVRTPPEAGVQAGPPDLPAPGPVRPAQGKSRRPLLLGVLRWTAAVLVCGGLGAGTAMGITAMERTDVPGLATESDGRWEYPRISLPALPADAPRPWTEGNPGEIHHADLRKLVLPAPAGATLDPKLNGGWSGLDSYLALLPQGQRGPVEEFMAESALRHVAARGWTTPDGTTTRIHLLRFSSVAFAEAFRDEVMGGASKGSGLPAGVGSAAIDPSTRDIEVPNVSGYTYAEEEPHGPEQTRWSYLQAGDTFGVVTQTRKGGVLTVPFQQTVTLQAQLLG